MKKASVSTLVKYLFPPMDNLIKGLIFVAAGIVASLIESNIWLFFLLLLLALFDFIPEIVKASRFLSQINYLKTRKEMQDIIDDFAEAETHMNGQLKIGKKYIFGKKSGFIVSYDDIKKIHHFVRKKYGYRKKRFVEVFTFEGDKIKLSKVNDNEKSAMQAEQVMLIVSELAPKAEVTVK